MMRFGLSRFPHLALSRTSSFGSGILSKRFLESQSQQQIVNFCACTVNNSRYSLAQLPLGSTKKYFLHEPHTDAVSPKYHGSVSPRRSFSSSSEESKRTEGEANLASVIRKCFPNATNIAVEDISGGCGSMYSIFIEAPEFQGLSTVKQHLLVNNALKQEIKSMHGIRIQTAAPKKS